MASAGRPPLKILLVGSAGVGKSSLMNRFVHNRFCSRYRATIGADFFTKVTELEGQRVTVQLWDTAGAERCQSLGMALYQGSHCCVLVFDVTVAASFQAVAARQAEPPNPKLFPFVLLGNKTDLPGRQVSAQEAEEWCAQTQAQYFETSAKDGTGVALAFQSALQAALRQQERWDPENPSGVVLLPGGPPSTQSCAC
ncbi:ras-related protein Rab-7a-like [Trichechus manatus latirostris]|uniref:Ras-related protein Rab-7a-like n=1 Tax=Trichechus manatus latirostris TaxID=127582 RepID=A0A2Y9EBD9_TRIMA|nr:ras-related protein Rab-7a-like [Trichechus manatus latirostris]